MRCDDDQKRVGINQISEYELHVLRVASVQSDFAVIDIICDSFERELEALLIYPGVFGVCQSVTHEYVFYFANSKDTFTGADQ